MISDSTIELDLALDAQHKEAGNYRSVLRDRALVFEDKNTRLRVPRQASPRLLPGYAAETWRMLEPVGPPYGNKNPMGKQASPPRPARAGMDALHGECSVGSAWCLGARTGSRAFSFTSATTSREQGRGLNIGNLRPICDRCNASMGNSYHHRRVEQSVRRQERKLAKNCCCAVM